MKKIYQVEGMTCQMCVGLLKNALEEHEAIKNVEVNYKDGTAIVVTKSEIDLQELNEFLAASGNYRLLLASL